MNKNTYSVLNNDDDDLDQDLCYFIEKNINTVANGYVYIRDGSEHGNIVSIVKNDGLSRAIAISQGHLDLLEKNILLDEIQQDLKVISYSYRACRDWTDNADRLPSIPITLRCCVSKGCL